MPKQYNTPWLSGLTPDRDKELKLNCRDNDLS